MLRGPHPLPKSLRVCVVLIHSLDVHGTRFRRISETHSNDLRRDLLARLRVISKEYSHGGIFSNNPCVNRVMRSLNGNLLGTEMRKQLECAVDGLRNAVKIEQAESAMKRHGRKIVFVENIREGPETITVYKFVRLHHYLNSVGSGERVVVIMIARI